MERSQEQRNAIKFCVRLGKNTTETFQMLQERLSFKVTVRKLVQGVQEELRGDEPHSGRQQRPEPPKT